jgi:hypothetical protein
MTPTLRCGALRVIVFALCAALVACGGRADQLGAPSGACVESICAGDTVWDPASCACVSLDAGPPPVVSDATTRCPPIACPQGSAAGVVAGECACILEDAGLPDEGPHFDDAYVYDAPRPDDAPYHDAPPSFDSPDEEGPFDAPHDYDAPPSFDSPDEEYPFDSPYDSPYTCGPSSCGLGFLATPSCQCVACTNTCPSGETPVAGCTGCTACPFQCPQGFDYGGGCNCVPTGTSDAGPDAAIDAGPITCQIGGYWGTCYAGSWCGIGICPDGVTQYGCYCNADGTATCQNVCPVPPPCTIPGWGTCAYGASCTFGSCGDAGGTELQCYCQQGGQAYCNTFSCGGVDAGGFDD